MQFFDEHLEENSTITKLTTKEGFGFALPNKKRQLQYQKDARRILDELSREFSPVGLGFLLSSLIVEYFEHEYNGKYNLEVS